MAESRYPGRRPALLLLAGLLALPAGAALGQETVYIGGTGEQVEINLDVLDALGTPPNVAGLLRADIRRSQGQARTPLPLPGEARPSVTRGAPLPPPSRPPQMTRRVTATPPAAAPAAPRTPTAALPTARRIAPATTGPKRIAAVPAAPKVTAPVPSAPKVASIPAPKVAAPARVAIPAPAPAAPRKSSGTPTSIPSIEVPAPPASSTRTAAITPPPPPPAVTAAPEKVAPAKVAPAKAAPAAKAARAPEPAPQVAAVSPAPKAPAPAPAASANSAVISVVFDADSKTLPGNADSILGKVAEKLKADETLRVQLMAYASAGERSEAKARRLSLSRALEVRSYLIRQGIASTRMDVRALGDRAPGAPGDRVDLTLVER